MSFDKSRFTFDPWSNYSGVVMEQGRVQLDSDWNEWLAELSRRIQAGTLDILGRAVYPATTPHAFEITASTDTSGQNHVSIGPGRMYVDGLLAENHGAKSTAEWDPALAELSGSPQPPAASPTGVIDFTDQPYYPGVALPSGDGPFLAYLDVWQRAVTYLEDPDLIDAAVNVDTTGRLQTVWQVKLAQLPTGSNCSTAAANALWPGPSLGQLTNDYASSAASGPCCLTSGTGYTGLENQFYRMEIHKTGTPATGNAYPAAPGVATFKWSRDNASVETGVTGIITVTNSLGNKATQLTVLSLGRDTVLGFAPGNWIEILDDNLELSGEPGGLHLIDSIDFAARTITLVDLLQTPANFPVDSSNQTTASRHTRIRRWDQSGKIYQTGANPGETLLWVDLGAAGSTGDIPVPPPGTTLILESGITVAFGPNTSTTFNTGDFWNFSARASTGQIDPLAAAPPRGIHHHYAPLAVVSFSPPSNPDCRTKWPPAGEASCGCCCTNTVGDGVNSFGQYTSIQAAINALPAAGGEVCILPGRYFENIFIEGLQDVVIHGCGYATRVASLALKPGYTAPAPAGTESVTTVNAVISIANSQHVQLRGFAVEAATDEAGILVDGTGTLIAPQPGNTTGGQTPAVGSITHYEYTLGLQRLQGTVDVTVEDIELTASTLPAIVARRATNLNIRDNRIAMANVFSVFPAVWLSGSEIQFLRNWVSIQTTANLRQWISTTVLDDMASDANNTAPTSGNRLQHQAGATRHPGGIQIAGPSKDVLVSENQIVGGLRNGITLGSYTVLDQGGNVTKYMTGLTFTMETDCTTSGSLSTPTTYSSLKGSTVAAAGALVNISIDRNIINNFGLCGIGPVGLFNLRETLEIIAIENLRILSNTITNTVARAIASDLSTFLGYGAICLPTVDGLVIRDNAISNFGAQPGLKVAGIFLLHGEGVEISRNQVLDNRDWADASAPDQAGDPSDTTAAVYLAVVTPPALAASSSDLNALALFEPGLPALRVEENLVRVPMGKAFAAAGYGPFAISDNHFSCGGNIPGKPNSALQCVRILNFGVAIELITLFAEAELYRMMESSNFAFNSNPPFVSSSGGVLFTSNFCQLELREVPQESFASVMIVSQDHLIFSNNDCWLDAGRAGMSVDAFLRAGSLQVTGNRFQDAQHSVLLSAWTQGVLNICTENISTYCIWAQGTAVLSNNNLSLANIVTPGACDKYAKG